MNQEDLQESILPETQGAVPEKKKTKKEKPKSGFAKGFAAGVIVMAVVSVVVFTVGSGLGNASGNTVLDRSTESKINTLVKYIQGTYYEDVDVEDLQEGLYAGLFENLDDYSRYYTAEEYKELYEMTLTGTFYGIGASLQQDMDTKNVTVIRVYEDSPAKEAGLKEGDLILKADDYEANEMELSEFVTHVRGEEGTVVHLVIYRESENEELEFDITRRSFDVPTVSGEMMENHTGYIAVTEFTEATIQQFSDALEELKSQGMEALIVDLRSNPGGVLTAACDMLDEILPEGLIVYTEDKDGKRVEYHSTDDKYLDIPIAVVVNGNSASASEIFAGAIQDRDAGIIVGTTTYGKGVVQTIRTLDDGSAFKITTNRYFTPGGTCIQGIGIKPDVEIEYEPLEEDETYSLETDNQIQKALEVLNEKR